VADPSLLQVGAESYAPDPLDGPGSLEDQRSELVLNRLHSQAKDSIAAWDVARAGHLRPGVDPHTPKEGEKYVLQVIERRSEVLEEPSPELQLRRRRPDGQNGENGQCQRGCGASRADVPGELSLCRSNAGTKDELPRALIGSSGRATHQLADGLDNADVLRAEAGLGAAGASVDDVN
jgi:hypothetical protein